MEPTWCWWENWTGWTRATPWRVKYGERLIASKNQNMRGTKNTAPKTDTREIVFVLRWKICIAEPGRSIWQRFQLSRDCPEDRRHRYAAPTDQNSLLRWRARGEDRRRVNPFAIPLSPTDAGG